MESIGAEGELARESGIMAVSSDRSEKLCRTNTNGIGREDTGQKRTGAVEQERQRG